MIDIGLEESWMHKMGLSVILVRLLFVHGFCNHRVLMHDEMYIIIVRALLELRICVGISDFGISCSKGHVIFARREIWAFCFF